MSPANDHSAGRHNEPMPLDEYGLWHILHALDDPEHLEIPADYYFDYI